MMYSSCTSSSPITVAMARAAAASAMAKVASKKVVLGDRFDVLGADGAAAFVSGAFDGMPWLERVYQCGALWDGAEMEIGRAHV